MSGRDPFREAPAATEEVAAARRLADALEGNPTAGADLDALAVVRLMETVSEAGPADEVAAWRLRGGMAADPRRHPRVGAPGRIAAVAAVLAGVALIGVVLHRAPRSRADESALLAREREARAAVVAVAGSWDSDDGPDERIDAISEAQWRLRVAAQFDAARIDELASQNPQSAAAVGSRAAPPATRTAPTPGGTS